MTAPLSRRRLIELAGGSVATAALLAACGDSGASIDTEEFGKGDTGILNFALALEHVEAGFYGALARAGVLSQASQELAEEFGVQEQEHVSVLTEEIKKLGGEPAAEPETDFSFDDEEDALAQASDLENAVAAGYLGQLLEVKGEAPRTVFFAIHTVEARHASAIAYLQHKSATTPDGAFAKPISEDEALAAAETFVS